MRMKALEAVFDKPIDKKARLVEIVQGMDEAGAAMLMKFLASQKIKK